MMDQVRQYVISVISAAILCGIVNIITEGKHAHTAIIRMITGIFMSITLISPLLKMQIDGLTEYTDRLFSEGNMAVANGKDIAQDELCSIIKSRTEAYILDKANSMKLDIEVEVEVNLGDEYLPLPNAVTLTGSVSPYSKDVLSGYIANELGIPREDQVWN